MPARRFTTSITSKQAANSAARRKEPEYRAWSNMKQRCLNPKSTYYRHYGGRGIKVYEDWYVYENFLEDMGRRPSAKHTIDRIDNDGDYTPENCRWVTQAEQMRNTRRTRHITYAGKTQTMTDWAKELNVPVVTLAVRIYKGWDIDRAMTTPFKRIDNKIRKPMRKLSLAGVTLTPTEWAPRIGIAYSVIIARMALGWSDDKVLTTPVRPRTKNKPK